MTYEGIHDDNLGFLQTIGRAAQAYLAGASGHPELVAPKGQHVAKRQFFLNAKKVVYSWRWEGL